MTHALWNWILSTALWINDYPHVTDEAAEAQTAWIYPSHFIHADQGPA